MCKYPGKKCLMRHPPEERGGAAALPAGAEGMIAKAVEAFPALLGLALTLGCSTAPLHRPKYNPKHNPDHTDASQTVALKSCNADSGSDGRHKMHSDDRGAVGGVVGGKVAIASEGVAFNHTTGCASLVMTVVAMM